MRDLSSIADPDLLMTAFDDFVGQWVQGSPAPSIIPSDSFLPNVVRRFYEIVARWPMAKLCGTQDLLVDFEELRVENDRATIIWENQGVWEVAIARSNPRPPMPELQESLFGEVGIDLRPNTGSAAFASRQGYKLQARGDSIPGGAGVV